MPVHLLSRRVPLAVLMLLLGLLGVSGCASLQSRERPAYRSRPHLYPSTTQDFNENDLPWSMNLGPALGYNDGTDCMPCCLPLDLPFSLVTDTVLLPYDLYWYRRYRFCFNAIYSAPTPTLVKFHRTYDSRFGDMVYVSTLAAMPAPLRQEKLLFLARSGISAARIGGSRLVNAEVAQALIDQGSVLGIRALAGNSATPAAILQQLADRSLSLVELAANTNAPPALLEQLSQTNNPAIHQALCSNPSSSDSILQPLAARDPDLAILVLRNHQAPSNALITACNTIISRYIPHTTTGGLNEVAECPAAPSSLLESILHLPPEFGVDDAIFWRLAKNPNITPTALSDMVSRTIKPGPLLGIARNPKTPASALALMADRVHQTLAAPTGLYPTDIMLLKTVLEIIAKRQASPAGS